MSIEKNNFCKNYFEVIFMKFERIRNLREDKDLTQTFMGKMLNINQRTYSQYENDKRDIPIEILSKLADFHNTSVDYLINRTDIKEPYPKKKQKQDQ